MSRTLSAGLATHLSGRSHTRCNMLLFDPIDGDTLGVTDHSADLDFDIGDGVVTYLSNTGILTSDVAMSASLDTDNYEVTGPIGDVVTLDAVLGGKYDRATARLFQVNHKSLADGGIKLLKGNVSSVRVDGGKFTFEVRSEIDRFNQVVGRLIVNNCDADFGDARCGAVPTVVTGTVTAVTDAMRFTVSFPGSFADAFFNMGKATPVTGANAGNRPVEIISWTAAGAIELFYPLVTEPVIGDTFDIQNGCSKARKSDDPTVPTCLTYDNVVNFRGFPEVPGSDQILRAAVPGEGNQ